MSLLRSNLFERVASVAAILLRVLRRFFLVALLVRALTTEATCASGADAKPDADPVRPFFAQHCQVCHEGTKPKGNFRLESLSHDFDDEANRGRWLTVLEQVKEGTMPPAEKPRPAAKDVETLAGWISERTAAAEAARGAAVGRVVLRRLNRAEYENTVRDLLAVDLDLKDLLPVDTSTTGFDNSAEALHVSSYLMDAYLEAADRILNAAIAGGPRPWTINKRFDVKDEKERQTERQRLSPCRRRRGDLQFLGVGQYPGRAVAVYGSDARQVPHPHFQLWLPDRQAGHLPCDGRAGLAGSSTADRLLRSSRR